MKPGSMIAIVLFGLVALGHVLRIALGLHVTVEATAIPMWVSIVGTLVPAAVAFMLWREGHAGTRVSA
jgi:hypothetical protein